MLKKILLYVMMLILLNFGIGINANAQGDLPGESVYASPEKQEEIAKLFDDKALAELRRLEVWALTESITPVYYVDVWEYIETKEWKLQPAVYKDGKIVADTESEETSVYAAKTTYYNGVYSGDIFFSLTNDGVVIETFKRRGDAQKVSLVSYADQYLRIFSVTGVYGNEKDDVYIPYTRYVVLGEFGSAYYVKREIKYGDYNKNYEFLLSLDSTEGIFGHKNNIQSIGRSVEDVVHFETDMEIVINYLQSLKNTPDHLEKKYLEAHSSNLRDLNNIINITEYLETSTFKFFTERDKLIGYTPKVVADETSTVDSVPQNDSKETVVETDDIANSSEKAENRIELYEIIALICVSFAVVLVCVLIITKKKSCKRNK